MARRPLPILGLLALLFAVSRLPWLPRAPDDIDAVNFTLGVRDFDVAGHRPHPPGYPVYIMLGKLAAPVFSRLAGAGAPAYRAEAMTLGFLSVLAGALAVILLPSLFLAFEGIVDTEQGPARPEGARRRALAATALTLCAPLFWLTTGRPMSDVPGLVAGLAAMALLASALSRQQVMARAGTASALPGADSPIVVSGRLIVLGALMAGLAMGVRSQTAWLTVPLLVFVLLNRTGYGAAGAWLGSLMTFTIGVLLWAVPLVIVSGGPAGYLRAFSIQAGEDLAGVRMLGFEPDPRRFALALIDMLVHPWHWPALGWIVSAAAVAGAAVLLARSRHGLLAVLVAFAPYALFHLLFQDTAFVRYALPLLPAVAYLAVRALDALLRRFMPVGVAVLCAAALIAVAPMGVAYAREESPVYRALSGLRGSDEAGAAAIAMHHAIAQALRGETLPKPVLPSPIRHEWLEVVRYWREGRTGPVVFLGDARRTDLAAFDPRSRQALARYRWAFPSLPLLQGSRPGELDAVRLDPPNWMAAGGWALTPELAGIARRDGTELGKRPIDAFVRRSPEESLLMLGGRNLGVAGGPDVRFTAALDEQPIDEWTTKPAPGFYLRFVPLPAGRLAGAGPYATLRVRVESADGSHRPVQAAVEQFDVQPAARVVFGFDAGWHEREFNEKTGRLFRWSSGSATTRVHNAGQDVEVTIEGESPLASFEAAPRVVLRAGSRVLAQASPTADFTMTAQVPAEALRESGGTITLETDRVFVPAERSSRSIDRRSLGLRIYRVDVRGASDVR